MAKVLSKALKVLNIPMSPNIPILTCEKYSVSYLCRGNVPKYIDIRAHGPIKDLFIV